MNKEVFSEPDHGDQSPNPWVVDLGGEPEQDFEATEIGAPESGTERLNSHNKTRDFQADLESMDREHPGSRRIGTMAGEQSIVAFYRDSNGQETSSIRSNYCDPDRFIPNNNHLHDNPAIYQELKNLLTSTAIVDAARGNFSDLRDVPSDELIKLRTYVEQMGSDPAVSDAIQNTFINLANAGGTFNAFNALWGLTEAQQQAQERRRQLEQQEAAQEKERQRARIEEDIAEQREIIQKAQYDINDCLKEINSASSRFNQLSKASGRHLDITELLALNKQRAGFLDDLNSQINRIRSASSELYYIAMGQTAKDVLGEDQCAELRKLSQSLEEDMHKARNELQQYEDELSDDERKTATIDYNH